jgi:MFS family permease
MEGVRKRVRDSAVAFVAILSNPHLRTLELAWAFAIVGHWAYTVAVSVYAYNAGGSGAVGLVFALRLFAAAVVSPFAGMLGDRYPRERILLGSAVTRAVLMGAAAGCAFGGVRPAVVYALAIAAAIATSPFRSAQAALTPGLARTPAELTAANAVVSTIESLAVFVGPALAGFLLAVTSTGAVFTVNAGFLVASALCITRLRTERVQKEPEIEASTIVSEALAGFRAIFGDRPLRVLTMLLTAQTLILGALEVYIVVLAFQVLDLGNSGVGILNTVMGVGALVGGVVALSLAGARRLSPPFALGVLFVGAPLIVLGAWPRSYLVLLLLALVAIGSTLLDVAGFTLVQRAVSDDVLARVFGVLQMLFYLSLALGAALAPILIDGVGLRTALVVTGGFLVALVILLWAPLAKIDATAKVPDTLELHLLTSIPIFAPLPATSIEHLAGQLLPLRVEAGTTVVRRGDSGDRFYLVAEGHLAVSDDGAELSTLHAGDYFGEIALLRDVPRTATVTAKTDTVLYALEREDFLAAVTGHPASAEAAESVVSARLAAPTSTGVRAAAP